MRTSAVKFMLLLSVTIYIHAFNGQNSLFGQNIEAQTGPGTLLWSQLLAAFEDHTEYSRFFIEQIAGFQEKLLESKLAGVLLSEWDLVSNKKELEAISLIDEDPIDGILGTILIKNPQLPKIINIEIKVSSLGKVLDTKFINIRMDQLKKERIEIQNKLKKFIFRPAFVNCKFTSGSFILSFRANIHYRHIIENR